MIKKGSIRKFIQKQLNKLPKKCTHQKELFVTGDNIAVVRCMICGSETMPWRVRRKTADSWRESNPDADKKLKQSLENQELYYQQFEK